jgi:hypothetical protein
MGSDIVMECLATLLHTEDISVYKPSILTEDFHGFCQCFQANGGILSYNSP